MSTVAVALCNYNHGKYLDGCLRAIVTQSRPADQIVIVDDGSTDDSKDIILDCAARHPTISAYFNGVNQGVMTSLKRAMGAVSSRARSQAFPGETGLGVRAIVSSGPNSCSPRPLSLPCR